MASMVRIFKNMVDLFSKLEKHEIYPIWKNHGTIAIVSSKEYSHRLTIFPWIFQAQFVSFSPLSMEWWRYSWKTGLDQIKSDLTNIFNSFSCFLSWCFRSSRSRLKISVQAWNDIALSGVILSFTTVNWDSAHACQFLLSVMDFIMSKQWTDIECFRSP